MLKALPVFILTSLFLVACGEGGGGYVRGERCKKSYKNPVNMNVPDGTSSKLQLKAGEIPEGQYYYQGAEIYFVDTETNFKMHLQHFKKKGEAFKTEVKCVRNYSDKLNGLNFTVQGLTGMAIEAGSSKISNLSSKNYTVQFSGGKRQFLVSENKSDLGEVPSKPYEDENTEYFLFHNVKNKYEVRSHKVLERGHVYMVIYLERES